MDPVTTAAIIGVGGGLLTNQSNAQQANEAGKKNRQMARETMAWQEKMSNTAYQRAREDMEKAGINPMSQFMSSASTPSGATGSEQAPHMEDALAKGVNSALETRRLQKEIKGVDSQSKLNEATAKAAAAQEKLNEANAKVAQKNAKIIDLQTPAIAAKSKYEEKVNTINEKAAYYDAIQSRIDSALGAANSAKDLILPKWAPKQKPKETYIDKNTGEILK